MDTPAWHHDTAIIDDGAQLGPGTKVWHFSHVCAGARIGAGCSLGQNVFVGNDVVIGSGVKIQNNVSVYDAVTLEDDVFCGPSVVFTNVYNPRAAVSRKHEYLRTVVKRGATLGANCTIVCGTTVGEHAFIGAGSVVNRDVPAFALMVGVPARRIGWSRPTPSSPATACITAARWCSPSAAPATGWRNGPSTASTRRSAPTTCKRMARR